MRAPDPSVLEAVATNGLDPGVVTDDRATDPVYLVDAERTVGQYAARLAAVHEVPAPSVGRLGPAQIVEHARDAVRSGRVDEHTLTPPYRHLRPERLLEVLDSGAGEFEPAALVLTHGRPMLAKLRCRSGAAVGFEDWDHAAWADPHRDLAVAAREVAGVLVPMLVPTFFELYRSARPGWAGPDPRRLDWYALAYELGA